MKKLLQLASLFLIAGVLLSSCGKGLYVTKRKYNKGFYIAHSHKAKKADVSQHEERTAKSQPVKVAERYVINTKTEESKKEQAAEPVQLLAQAPADLKTTENIAHNEKASAFVPASKPIKLLDNLLPNNKYSKELKQKLNAHNTDALSLVWVIILVILLVYLIALLFDAFGLGWFIHILALIALILLILWLLRVI